jgi:hypothetical protein
VLLLNPRSISVRVGMNTAFVIPIMAVISFSADGRAQTPEVLFNPTPLSASRDSFVAPPMSFENYTVDARLRPLGVPPKLDFSSWERRKQLPFLYKDNFEDLPERISLNGGSFGLEADPKFDLKKIAPSEFVQSNIERREKLPYVGLSIVTPYNSE